MTKKACLLIILTAAGSFGFSQVQHSENTFADKVITSNSLIRESPFELGSLIAGILTGCMVVTVALLLWAKYRHAIIRYYAGLIGASTATATIVFVQWLIVAMRGGSFADLDLWGVVLYVTGLLCLSSFCYAFGFFFLSLVDRKPKVPMKLVLAGPFFGLSVVAALILIGLPHPFSVLNLMFLLTEIWLVAELLGTVVLLIAFRKKILNRYIRQGLAAAALVSSIFLTIWALELSGILTTHLAFLFFPVWNIVSLTIAAIRFFKPESGPLVEKDMIERFAATFGLTPREIEVAALLAEGVNYNMIADSLGISGKTVRNHITNIYGKTNIGSRLQLINLIRKA